MIKKTLLNFWLLLLCMIVGASSAWGQSTYQLVTNVSQLSDGDVILIASGINATTTPVSKMAVGAANTSNNRKAVPVSVAENKITTTVDNANETISGMNVNNDDLTKPLEITLVASSSNWNLKEVIKDDNIIYLNGGSKKSGSGNNNVLKAGESVVTSTGQNNANGVWSIAINTTTYVATINNQNNYTIKKNSSSAIFASYSSGQEDVYIYKKLASKTASDLTINKSTINLAIGGTTTGDIAYTTSSNGAMHFTSNNTSVATVNSTGTVTAVAEGSTTITVSQDEGTGYAASGNLTVTVNVSDARTAVGSITAISPTTVYVGQIGDFTLTQSMTGAVSSYAWSLGDGEDEYLTLDDEMFEGLKEGNVTVTVTATPTDASTYKPVTASFPVRVDYKYAAPSLPAAAVFFSTKSITIPAVAGADVYYTTDGSTPTKSSTKSTAAFDVSATTTVKAIAIDEDGLVSPVSSVTYTKEAVLDINYTEITFEDFSGAGSGYENGAEKNLTFTATDDETQLKITGTNIMSNSGLQVRSTPGTFTTQYIKNGTKAFSLTATFTNGLSYKISYADGSDDTNGTLTSGTAIIPSSFPCKFTFTRSSGTPVITEIVLTPLKDPVATDVAITDPGILAKDATGTFAYTTTTEEDNTASWTSATIGVITITNAATGAYTAAGRGTSKITLKLTPTDATTYRAVTAERTITVTAPVEVSASDVEMTYGDAAKAIGATTSAGYAGTLTYASGNTSIATVDASGNVTAVAAGTTTITISAPADAEHLYTAGDDKVINVTVSAPAGSGTAAEYTQTAKEYEALTSAATGWTYTNWTTSASYGACSTAGTAGQLKTKDYLIPDKANPCVFFKHTGKTFDDPSIACKLYVQEGSNTPVELSIPKYFKGDKYDNPYIESGDIDISDYIGKKVHFIFDYSPSTDNEGKWEVKDFGIYYDAFGVKLNASGYATYCSQYPLDFSKENAEDKGFTAWQVTDVSSETITFSQITSGIKGGQGIFLKGSPNAVVTLTSADSSEELDDNLFIGTTAPTYLTQVNGDYTNFALSATYSDFRKIKTGIVPANKAYLPVLTKNIPAGARLSFVFEDDQTTTIQGVSVRKTAPDTYYNLKGQRVDNPKKGGIYVKNGKKVIFK